MKDRYLFRGKTCNGKWVEGFLNTNADRNRFYISNKAGAPFAYEIRPDTICQCTGLRDKTGKLIWENDIVAFWDTYSTENGPAEADCIGEIVWEEETLSFEVTDRLSAESYEVLEDCCVVGNALDNPELLEV